MFTKIKALSEKIGHAVKKQKLFAVQLILILLTGTIVVTLDESVKTIQIKDEEVVTQIRTVQSDPYEILELAGIALGANDKVVVSDDDQGVIEVNRAFPVTVTVDGEAKTLQMYAGQTVADALQLYGTTIDADDQLSHKLTDAVEKDMQICVTKIEVTYSTVARPMTNDHKVEYTYETKTVGGKAEPAKEVAAKPVAVSGSANVISTLTPEKPIELDASGRPVQYAKKLTGKATAYCKGTTCATGVKVRPGYIAVNPKQIPYGTKMYIVSADGKYNYGYAIAADTGGFAKDGSAIADLYMNNYDDCIQFGRRYIEIYILD